MMSDYLYLFLILSSKADTARTAVNRTASADAKDHNKQCTAHTHADCKDRCVFASFCGIFKTLGVFGQTGLVDIVAVVMVRVVRVVRHVAVSEVSISMRRVTCVAGIGTT